MPDDRIFSQGITLAEALHSLPLETPERSAWPELMAQLPTPQRARRWPWAVAAAAVLAVAVFIPLSQRAPPNTASIASVPVATSPLTLVMNESAQLEQLLGHLDNPHSTSASSALISLQLEDQLEQLDGQLSVAALSDVQRLRLWQVRVGLLREYAGVQSTQQWLSSQGERLDGALVAVY